MNPDDIARILDELGERLGPAGSYVFELAVRQVWITGLLGAIVGGGLLLAIAVGTAKTLRFAQRRYRANPSADLALDYGIPGILGALVVLLPTGPVTVWFLDSITKLLNPEYAALTDILSRIVP